MNILSQLIVTVTSRVRILYHTGCENIYPEDGQDWLQFGLKFTTSQPKHHSTHRLIDFISQYFIHYPFLNYIYINYIFSTEIVIICSCEGVAATQHNVCSLIILVSPWTTTTTSSSYPSPSQISCLMLSSHLYFGLPFDLLVRGFHLNIFLTVLVSGILCTWPNQFSLWALVQLTIYFVLSIYLVLHCVLIPHILFSFVGPNILKIALWKNNSFWIMVSFSTHFSEA